MARTPLAESEVATRFATLAGWKREGKAIGKKWEFEDFAHAVMFTNAIAHLADQVDHHPDLALGYAYVRVTLTTHDAGGLTGNDFDLASAIDALPLRWYGKVSDA